MLFFVEIILEFVCSMVVDLFVLLFLPDPGEIIRRKRVAPERK